jgi:hypothetical protein
MFIVRKGHIFKELLMVLQQGEDHSTQKRLIPTQSNLNITFTTS